MGKYFGSIDIWGILPNPIIIHKMSILEKTKRLTTFIRVMFKN